MILYQHRQYGLLTVVAVIVSAALLLTLLWLFSSEQANPARVTMSIVAVTVILVLFLFSSLNVTVSEELLVLHFGPGVISKRIKLEEVREVQPVRNRWYYGWGIRLTPHGWLFNVSGLDAVELLLGSGRRFRVGTDEPEVLARAIQNARRTAA